MACFCYLLIGAIIVFGAGLVARLMASTELGGAGLGFVSWLVCFMLFCCCGAFCFFIAGACSDDDAAESVGTIWLAIGMIASVLCIVLSHIGNRIDFMEAAEPAYYEVDPRYTGPSNEFGYPLATASEAWQQDRVREFEFADSFIDLSLGNARTIDISRSCGENCQCARPKSFADFIFG